MFDLCACTAFSLIAAATVCMLVPSLINMDTAGTLINEKKKKSVLELMAIEVLTTAAAAAAEDETCMVIITGVSLVT